MEEMIQLIPFGAPEIFTFLGIILFVSLSLATYFLRESLPRMLPLLYQLVALEGLMQMFVANFSIQTSIGIRSALSLIYFVIAITNIAGLSVFSFRKRLSFKI